MPDQRPKTVTTIAHSRPISRPAVSQHLKVLANGELLTCEPTDVLPMAQRYFMF